MVYIVSNDTVKVYNLTYNHLKSHHDIFLGSSSTIQPCLEEYPFIPLHCFHFKSIHEIQTTRVNSMVDLVGLVISVSLASTIRKIYGSEKIYCTVGLRDISGYSIDITLWGEHCQIEGVRLSNLRGLDTPSALETKGGCVT